MADSNTILPAELQHLALKQPEKKESDGLDQTDFLELMLTQLKHQDPLNPAESSEFIAQMASFATVNGVTELNTSFATLSSSLQSSQALQASTIVGSSVLVPSDKAELSAGSQVSGKVFNESSASNLILNISDAAGQTVKKISLGTQEAGLIEFTWDGSDNNGELLPAGTYTIEAATVTDGESVAQTVLVNAKVESVSLITGAEPLLNLNGLGSYSMNDVLEIM
jgi:flagellar basal-body rod modification protein FlgD